MTRYGVTQLKPINPFSWQQAETVAATHGFNFEHTSVPGNMVAVGLGKNQMSEIRKVDFGKGASSFEAKISGKGTIEIYSGKPEGKPIAKLNADNPQWDNVSVKLNKSLTGVHDLCFVYRNGDFKFDEWRFLK